MGGIRRTILALAVLTLRIASEVHSQDCKVAGERCADAGQCCGGCCVRGICIDTNRDCTYVGSVCRYHSCIGEADCQIFVPPECPGCEPIPVCMTSPDSPKKNETRVRYDLVTEAPQNCAYCMHRTIYSNLIIIILLYFVK